MKVKLKIIFVATMTVIWLSLHYFSNLSVSQSATSVKQRLLDEVASARIRLARSASNPSSILNDPENLFVFRSGREVFWSDNRTPVTDTLLKLRPGFVDLENGLYLLHKKTSGDSTILYLKLIQEVHTVRNRYIEPYHMFRGELLLVPSPGFIPINLGQQTVFFQASPRSLTSLNLFNPEFYASSSINPSLGWLTVNLLLLGAVVLIIVSLFRKLPHSVGWSLSVATVIGIGTLCSYVLKSLIEDGKLNLEFFNFNTLTSIDLVVPLLLVWFAVLLFSAFYHFYSLSSATRWYWTLPFLLVYNLIQYLFGHYDLVEINWFAPILFTPYLFNKPSSSVFQWSHIFVLICVTFGWYWVLGKHQRLHLRAEQALFAEKLAVNNDPVAEYIINESIPDLEERYDPETDVAGVAFLEDNLFLGYLSKYSPQAVDDSVVYNNGFYFRFLGQAYQLRNRYNTSGFGFPELLANREFSNYQEKGYSTARFSSGHLLQSSGSYVYKKNLLNEYSSPVYLERNGYLHYIKPANGDLVVVSYPVEGYLYNFATATYLFLLALAGSLPWIIRRDNRARSLQLRIQFAFLSLVILTVIVFGTSTYLYISDQFDEKNRLQLSEKILSVETELHEKLHDGEALRRSGLQNQLQKMSEIFFTDISLYSIDGELIASSQPAVFTKGALSRRMEPGAYRKMNNSGANLVIQQEMIGNLSYLSAYKPFSDSYNNTVGYLNLPYFAKQLELNKQLSSFLVSTLTALVLLTALALAVAIFLSSRITEPLKTIRLKLQSIDLQKENQRIDYPVRDEIGQLVEAYNRKVSELLDMAGQLARNEREMAWREMAKQVAHEIKNPLTPIKLNAQLLQRNLDANDPQLNEKMRRFISGLIDQVNTLTKIANEFSNYAALPKAMETEIDLSILALNTAGIMSDEFLVISTSVPDEPVMILADKDLMVRVINNLVKNAVQAVSEKSWSDGEKPAIRVSVSEKGTVAELSVSDNGPGIPKDIRERIFTPKFTTKSTGMGLGLAMVRQIVEQAGGSIGFESGEDSGTVFTVRLPIIRNS